MSQRTNAPSEADMLALASAAAAVADEADGAEMIEGEGEGEGGEPRGELVGDCANLWVQSQKPRGPLRPQELALFFSTRAKSAMKSAITLVSAHVEEGTGPSTLLSKGMKRVAARHEAELSQGQRAAALSKESAEKKKQFDNAAEILNDAVAAALFGYDDGEHDIKVRPDCVKGLLQVVGV